MARLLQTLLTTAVVAFLVIPAAGATAPDPRAADDAAACMDAVSAALPEADSATTCVVAYGHILAPGRALLNLAVPPEHAAPQPFRNPMPTLTGFWEYNHYEFELDASAIEYNAAGDPRSHLSLHRDRPIDLLEEVPVEVVAHFTVDQMTLSSSFEPRFGAHPCVVVEATLLARPARHVGPTTVLSSASADGTLLQPRVPISATGCQDADAFTPDADGITTFRLTLPAATYDPVGEDRVVLDLRVFAVDSDGTEFDLPGVMLHQDTEHLNRVVFPVRDTLEVDSLRGRWSDDRLYVDANVSSPWGLYDVDPAAVQLRIFPDKDAYDRVDRTIGEIPMGEPIVRYSLCHGCSDDPLRITFPVDILAADLPDGRYTMQVVAENSQRTGHAVAEEAFLISGGGSTLILYSEDSSVAAQHILHEAEAAPASVAPVLVLLGILLGAARRRTAC